MIFPEAKNIRGATEVAVAGNQGGISVAEMAIQAELVREQELLANADGILADLAEAIIFAAAKGEYKTSIIVCTAITAFTVAVTRLVTKVLSNKGFTVEVIDTVGTTLRVSWSR